MSRKQQRGLSISILVAFSLYFTFDLFTLRRFLNHPEYVNYYHAFRKWFLETLLQGHFPKWNPYWGIGDTAQIEASLPVDIFSPLEILFGPHYHLFQPVQIGLLLLAAFWALRRIHIHPFVAVPAAIFFVSSPWTSYFFLYYLKPLSFIAFVLCFPLTFLWFQSGRWSSLIALMWISALSMPGTKMEFWFFHYVTLSIVGLACTFAWPRRKQSLQRKRLCIFIGSLAIAILANAWQWVPLLQVLSNTKRLDSALGFTMLMSQEFYEKLWLGIKSSEIISLGVVCIPIILAIRESGKRRFLYLGAAILSLFLLKPFAFPGWAYLNGVFGVGAALGLLLLILSKQFRPVTLVYFAILSLYWCRVPPGDLRETLTIQTAPILFRAITGAMVMIAASGIAWSRFGRIALALWISIFLLRDQGQTILAFFNGFMWIPTRDTFILEYVLALLSAIGFQKIARGRVWFPALCLTLSLLLSTLGNPFYAHPLLKKNQGEFPRYAGEENLINAFSSLKDPTSRIYLFEPEAMLNLKALSASLSAQKNQVTLFSSLLSSRYQEWVTFQTHGIKPEQKWSAHEAEYTPETIAKLPFRNTLGQENDIVYRHSLLAHPPPNLDTLRLLGVTHVIQPNPPILLEGLKEYKFGSHYTTAKVKGALPRAFSIQKLEATDEEKFKGVLDPTFDGKKLNIATKEIPVKPVTISRYDPEHVTLIADLKEDSIVVLTDAFHPFWKAKIDGMFVPIFPALSIYRAVTLSKGRHEIDFLCEIPYFTAGIALSLSMFCLMAAATLVSPFLGIKRRPLLWNKKIIAT